MCYSKDSYTTADNKHHQQVVATLAAAGLLINQLIQSIYVNVNARVAIRWQFNAKSRVRTFQRTQAI